MILDERGEFADALAIPTGLGRNNFGDVVDLGITRDAGAGEEVWFVVQITAAVTSAGAATVDFQLVSDAVNPPLTDGTASLHFASGAKALAALGAKAVPLAAPISSGILYERYLGVQAVVGTAALTGGSANAFLTKDYAQFRAYNDAI